MNHECELKEDNQNPIDDRMTDLGGAVESLSDDELRDLLIAFLSEWRKRCDAKRALPN